MKLYLITAPDDFGGWDTYDSAIVAAKSSSDARTINPSEYVTHVTDDVWMGTFNSGGEYDQGDGCGWIPYCEIGNVKVEYLGETKKDRGVVLASFNAG